MKCKRWCSATHLRRHILWIYQSPIQMRLFGSLIRFLTAKVRVLFECSRTLWGKLPLNLEWINIFKNCTRITIWHLQYTVNVAYVNYRKFQNSDPKEFWSSFEFLDPKLPTNVTSIFEVWANTVGYPCISVKVYIKLNSEKLNLMWYSRLCCL